MRIKNNRWREAPDFFFAFRHRCLTTISHGPAITHRCLTTFSRILVSWSMLNYLFPDLGFLVDAYRGGGFWIGRPIRGSAGRSSGSASEADPLDRPRIGDSY